MKAYTSPVLISNNITTPLERISFGISGSSGFKYDEAWLQKFLFENSQSIPFDEIDKTFSQIIPVCCELSTPAGPLDILYVTPEGKLVILEAKLWRNPEARRKVVAQVLDYAKELNSWSYEDLQREISKASKRKGNVLYQLVKERFPDVDEADFVDEVSRSMKRGDFLLLIVGDGIREGTQNIAKFMKSIGNLQFTLGLIEVSIYKLPDQNLLVQPRILAKTTIIERTVIELNHPELIVQEKLPSNEEKDNINEEQAFYSQLWGDFIKQLNLDDVTVRMSETPKAQNFYLYPSDNNLCWISAYFMNSKNRVGVYFRSQKGDFGDQLYEFFLSNKDKIDSELGSNIGWEDKGSDKPRYIFITKTYNNVLDKTNRAEIFEFFNANLNNFINTFKPLIKQFLEQQEQ